MVNLEKVTKEEAALIAAKREYQRKWRAKNKDKVKAIQQRFYEKQFKKFAEEQQTEEINKKWQM